MEKHFYLCLVLKVWAAREFDEGQARAAHRYLIGANLGAWDTSSFSSAGANLATRVVTAGNMLPENR